MNLEMCIVATVRLVATALEVCLVATVATALEVCLVATVLEVCLVATALEVCLVATVLEVASVSIENLFFVFVIIVIISKYQQTKSKGA